jgi:MOSC domain-containing protein YiiM
MMQGTIVSIQIAPDAGAPVVTVQDVRAVSGKGLEGDRYFTMNTSDETKHKPDEEVTLVDAEHVEVFSRDYDVAITTCDTRRNIVTRGIELNDLVGKDFLIGDVRFRGHRLCEPCAYLAEITTPKILEGLVHKGGLRAQILSDGVIHVGDTIMEA